MAPAETITYQCRVRDLTWADRRPRYAVATWCHENLVWPREIIVDDQGHMVIHTCDPEHHMLATLVWD